MRINTVMEIYSTFARAYDYYQRMLSHNKERKSPDYLLSLAARTFGLNDLKKFKEYAMDREEHPEKPY